MPDFYPPPLFSLQQPQQEEQHEQQQPQYQQQEYQQLQQEHQEHQVPAQAQVLQLPPVAEILYAASAYPGSFPQAGPSDASTGAEPPLVPQTSEEFFRPSTTEDWARYKDIIVDLYSRKDLPTVMAEMQARYRFLGT